MVKFMTDSLRWSFF